MCVIHVNYFKDFYFSRFTILHLLFYHTSHLVYVHLREDFRIVIHSGLIPTTVFIHLLWSATVNTSRFSLIHTVVVNTLTMMVIIRTFFLHNPIAIYVPVIKLLSSEASN